MKNGDLANTIGYTIAFRCEDCLIKYKTEGFKNKILNAVIGKVARAEIYPPYSSAMEYLYRNTEYVVDLVVLRKNYTEELKHLIEDLPFSRIVVVDKDSQISQRLLMGDITLYVDDDDYRRSLINSEYAIPLSRLNEFIKRRNINGK